MDQPEIYLRSQVRNMIVYGVYGWYMSVEKYVRAAVENVEKNLAKSNEHLQTLCKNPIISGYWPETDTLPELKSEEVTRYQEMVGLLRWEVDKGQVDILLDTAVISNELALPHRGHLEHILHVSGYLKVNLKRNL